MKKIIYILSRLKRPNIGHTLMHEGIKNVLKKTFQNKIIIKQIDQLEFFEQIYNKTNIFYWLKLIPYKREIERVVFSPFMNLLNNNFIIKFTSKFINKDVKKATLAIAVGGPHIISLKYGTACHRLQFEHLHSSLKNNGIPVLNLSVGSCYPYLDSTNKFKKNEKKIFSKWIESADFTCVRDLTAKRIYNELGFNLDLVPCTVLLALDQRKSHELSKKPRIIINFMEKWPLSEEVMTFKVDPEIKIWIESVEKLISKYKNNYKFTFVCHSKNEMDIAKKRFPNFKRIFPKTKNDYVKLTYDTAACIAGRIHCAIPLASAGIPSMVIGTDTRMNTAKAIGINCFDIKNITAKKLENEFLRMIKKAGPIRKTYFRNKNLAFKLYSNIIKKYYLKSTYPI